MAYLVGVIFALTLLGIVSILLVGSILFELASDNGVEKHEYGTYIGIAVIWAVGVSISAIILVYSQ